MLREQLDHLEQDLDPRQTLPLLLPAVAALRDLAQQVVEARGLDLAPLGGALGLGAVEVGDLGGAEALVEADVSSAGKALEADLGREENEAGFELRDGLASPRRSDLILNRGVDDVDKDSLQVRLPGLLVFVPCS